MRQFAKVLFVCLLLVPVSISAYEKSLLNMSVPSALEAGQMQVSVRHRFYGAVDDEPFSTFFGLRYGGNVGLALRGSFGKGTEAGIDYVFNRQEWLIGAAYNVFPRNFFLSMRVEAMFFSFEPRFDDRRTGIFTNLAVQAEGRSAVRPILNVGYDSHYEEMIVGIGVDAAIAERFSILGEYYPRRMEGRETSVAVGIRVETYGHHFLLMVGRSTDIGIRHIGLGTPSGDWHLGFTIHRLLEL